MTIPPRSLTAAGGCGRKPNREVVDKEHLATPKRPAHLELAPATVRRLARLMGRTSSFQAALDQTKDYENRHFYLIGDELIVSEGPLSRRPLSVEQVHRAIKPGSPNRSGGSTRQEKV